MSRLNVVILTPDERSSLTRLLQRRSASSLVRRHCRILLLADSRGDRPYLTDAQIGSRVGCSARSVARTRASFVRLGLEQTIRRKPRSDRPRRRLSPQDEARLIALALGPAPDGRARWTVRALTDAVIAQGIVPTISRETVRLTLKKGGVRPG